MAAKLHIAADTSQVKKSLLDLGKSFKSLKGSSISIFKEDDKKFLRDGLKKEMSAIRSKIMENKAAITEMMTEQKKFVEGTKEELEVRQKILDAYKTQAKLGKQLGHAHSAAGDMKSPGQEAGGSIMGAVGSFVMGIPKLIAGAVVATTILKGFQATNQYISGTPMRNRLKGLGVNEENFGSPQELARAGITEQDMVQRRIEATAVLGRQGTDQKTEMKKANFERAFGLEGGTMTGIASQLRGSMGGKGATDAQMKLQASVLAAGIEDAIGPYLSAATDLLTKINENGLTQTDEITGLMAQLTKDGERTPEMLAKTFEGLNNSIKDASGESSAFIQTAFARAGIGGGTLGGTKFAMSSGGLMGLSKDELEKRGYNKDLINNMDKSGLFAGAGKRSEALLNQVKTSAGMGKGQKIGDITDVNKMVGISNLMEKALGAPKGQGFEVAQMLEKVQNKQMSQNQFDKKLKEMQENQDPSIKRLDDINKTLSGQTEILTNINSNLLEALGKQGVVPRNEMKGTENLGIFKGTDAAKGINKSFGQKGLGTKMMDGASSLLSGDTGWLEDLLGIGDKSSTSTTSQKPTPVELSPGTIDAVGKSISDNLKNAPIVNNTTVKTNVQLPDGRSHGRTTK